MSYSPAADGSRQEIYQMLEPDFHLVTIHNFVANGPLRSELHGKSRKLGVDKHVHFINQREDVPALLATADIFVLPSRYEGMSVSLLEAVQAGLPSVVSDVGDNGEVIRDGWNGYLFNPDDPITLKDKLDLLINNEEIRQEMARMQSSLSEKFSGSRMAIRTGEVYRALEGSSP
jgi:glycosyltransferase involved in cell wall biosynthesis